MKIRIAGVIAMLMLAAVSAGAADYYVSPAGNNGDPGSSVSPWQTITYAARQAQSGDTIHVISGTYNENGISFANPGVTVAGDDMPVIKSSDTIFTVNQPFVTVTGLDIESWTSKIVSSNTNNGNIIPVVLIASGNVTLSNSTISQRGFGGYKYYNPEQGGCTPGIYIYNASSNTIQNNVIATQNINSPGISISASSKNTIVQNRIDARHSHSISIADSDIQENYDHYIDTTNTGCNNAPIYYWYGRSGIILDDAPTDEIIAAYCSNLTIRNIAMLNAEGIVFAHTTNSNITNYTNTRVMVSSTVSGAYEYPAGSGMMKWYTMVKSTKVEPLHMFKSDNNSVSSFTVIMGGRHNYGAFLYGCNYNTLGSIRYVTDYIMGSGLDGHNDIVQLHYSDHNTLADIYGEHRTWSDHFFYFRYADNNTIRNITIEGYSNHIEPNIMYCSNQWINVHVNTRGHSSYAFANAAASTDYVYDSVFVAAYGSVEDGDIESGDASVAGTAYLINTLYSDSRLKLTGTLYRQWYLDTEVKDSFGDVVAGATVTVTDRNGAVVKALTTGANGKIAREILTEYMQNASSKTYSAPYTVTAEKSGYTVSVSTGLSGNAQLVLSLGTDRVLMARRTLALRAVNGYGDPLKGVTVTAVDKNGRVAFSLVTAADGSIAPQTVTEYTQDMSSRTYYTPYLITAERQGYSSDVEEVALTQDTEVVLHLERTEQGDKPYVYPVPYRKGKDAKVRFVNLRVPSKIEIYTLDGMLAWEKEVQETSYGFVPDDLSSGVYLYLIKDPAGTESGKIVIIK